MIPLMLSGFFGMKMPKRTAATTTRKTSTPTNIQTHMAVIFIDYGLARIVLRVLPLFSSIT